jgi:hypothetical protein
MTQLLQWVDDAGVVAARDELAFLDRVALAVVEGLMLHGDVERMARDGAIRRIISAVAFDMAVDMLNERRLRREAVLRAMGRAEQ